ncbi:Mucin 2 precursor [Lachnospiraceae bacterium TWA4]|nr:Mucin 2 precursor [Lachnospiraceae bacterium TWA4]
MEGKTKKKEKKSIKSTFKTIYFRHGSFSVLLSIAIIAVAIFANLATGMLPEKYRQIDLSSSGIYTLGEQTKTVLKNLDTDINVYLLFQERNEDSRLNTLLDRYKELNSHIKTSYIDPVTNPTFSNQYSSESLKEGSIIVESDKRYTVIGYNDIYVTEYSTDGNYVQQFDGEGQITSAIDYVTTNNLPKIYVVTGHDEVVISETATNRLSKANFETESLNLLSVKEIPDDCSALIINGPTSDFSSDEADTVIGYLEDGGSALITTNYTTESMENFNRILANYGLKTTSGLVLEGDSDKYYSNPLYVLPTIENHQITSPLMDAGVPVLVIQTLGLDKTQTRSTVEMTDLLTTSSSSFVKEINNGQLSSYEKEEGDQGGPISLGVAITEKISEEAITHLTVFSTPHLLNDSIIETLTVCNTDLFVNALSWMAEQESTISIDTKSLTDTALTATAYQANLSALIFIVILPLSCILIGFVIWLRRRKM